MIQKQQKEGKTPLLERASTFFQKLTKGSFKEIGVDFLSYKKPVLSCHHNSGKEFLIEDLSEGSRDQLYLSLRLASIEKY